MHGSSPRLWGTFTHEQSNNKKIRFIPTPVGNILSLALSRSGRTVHPHACGEHGDNCSPIWGKFGSSPRLWGTFWTVSRRAWPCAGSSPRLWGTSTARSINGRIRRFIPTPVGNMWRFCKNRAHHPVHPHACGEHYAVWEPRAFQSGSSPRLWGTCIYFGFSKIKRRFIPTPVGNMQG